MLDRSWLILLKRLGRALLRIKMFGCILRYISITLCPVVKYYLIVFTINLSTDIIKSIQTNLADAKKIKEDSDSDSYSNKKRRSKSRRKSVSKRRSKSRRRI